MLLEGGGWTETYEDGALIFEEGDEGSCLYVVLSGVVRIEKRGDVVTSVIAELGPGEMFGESAIIEGRERAACARAVGRTVLAAYDREAFLRALREDPELGLRAMGTLCERLRVTTQRLQDLAQQYVLDRAELALTERAILEGDIA